MPLDPNVHKRNGRYSRCKCKLGPRPLILLQQRKAREGDRFKDKPGSPRSAAIINVEQCGTCKKTWAFPSWRSSN